MDAPDTPDTPPESPPPSSPPWEDPAFEPGPPGDRRGLEAARSAFDAAKQAFFTTVAAAIPVAGQLIEAGEEMRRARRRQAEQDERDHDDDEFDMRMRTRETFEEQEFISDAMMIYARNELDRNGAPSTSELNILIGRASEFARLMAFARRRTIDEVDAVERASSEGD